MMEVVLISMRLQLVTSMLVMVWATEASGGEVMSGAGACEVVTAGTEVPSKAGTLASSEVEANVEVSAVILSASSELSLVQRMS